jgi:alcohol dehydrogenase class IV
MTSFEFATATRLVFGPGTAARLPELCRPFGTRALIVTGSNPGRAAFAIKLLTAAGISCETFSIQGEPTLDDARRGAACALQAKAQMVIGLGGGSAVDAGKAIAALATQPEDVLHYLEVVGRGQPLDKTPLPYIAMPTTAGTGAEVTRNAVLASAEHGVKASLRHASMLPQIALVDPVLALGCPPAVTAASGMDALTQCLEAFVSCRAQPMTDALCREGIRLAIRSLEKAVNDGGDLEAREDMALAAMFSGMALANAGLGAVHGFAAPIGGQFHAPHGAVCAALLAPVWLANWKVVKASDDDAMQDRFTSAGMILTQNQLLDGERVAAFLGDLTRRLEIPGLRTYGITESDLPDIAGKAAQASSMKGNPVKLSQEMLVGILQQAL